MRTKKIILYIILCLLIIMFFVTSLILVNRLSEKYIGYKNIEDNFAENTEDSFIENEFNEYEKEENKTVSVTYDSKNFHTETINNKSFFNI